MDNENYEYIQINEAFSTEYGFANSGVLKQIIQCSVTLMCKTEKQRHWREGQQYKYIITRKCSQIINPCKNEIHHEHVLQNIVC